MSLPSGLLETLTGAGVAFAASIAASVLSSLLWAAFTKHGGRFVALRFPSGKKVRLDLDESLPAAEVNQLIARTIRSVETGDEAALKAVVEDSRAASVRGRGQSRGLA